MIAVEDLFHAAAEKIAPASLPWPTTRRSCRRAAPPTKNLSDSLSPKELRKCAGYAFEPDLQAASEAGWGPIELPNRSQIIACGTHCRKRSACTQECETHRAGKALCVSCRSPADGHKERTESQGPSRLAIANRRLSPGKAANVRPTGQRYGRLPWVWNSLRITPATICSPPADRGPPSTRDYRAPAPETPASVLRPRPSGRARRGCGPDGSARRGSQRDGPARR